MSVETALKVLAFAGAWIVSAVAFFAFGYSGAVVVTVAFICGLVIDL